MYTSAYEEDVEKNPYKWIVVRYVAGPVIGLVYAAVALGVTF
jgi:hypothetical protein